MQLDLFEAVAEVEADQRLRAGIDRTPVPLFGNLPPVHELHRTRDKWIADHGRFGASASLHLWRLGPTVPGSFLDTDVLADRFGGPCAATVLYLDLRGDFHGRDDSPCSCVGDLYYRGACLGCGWSSPHTRDSENGAAEDALDHHHPGWRDLPLVDRCPERGTSRAQIAKVNRWTAAVNAVYPAGWLAAGGPIRTARQPMGSRHVPNATPWAGYDVGVITTERNTP